MPRSNANKQQSVQRWPHRAALVRVETQRYRAHMDFFNSLTLDLKMLVVGIAGCALLALFSGNPRTEKRYLVVLAVLAAAGVFRFTHTGRDDQSELRAAASTTAPIMKVEPKHVPIASTSAR